MSSNFLLNAITTNGSAVTATSAAPPAGYKLRCRALAICATGDGTNSTGPIKFVVRDGASGVGTIIFTAVLNASSTGSSNLTLSNMDLRSSLAITIESTTGGGNTTQLSVFMEGDIVSIGYPSYAIPQGT